MSVVFAVWGLGVALLCGLLWWWGVAAKWSGWVLAGRLLLLLAAAMSVLARLLIRPQPAYQAAIGLAILGALTVLIGHGFGFRKNASR